jgi:ferredoxin
MTTLSGPFRVVLVLPNDDERTILVTEQEHIWDAAYAQGVRLPALCHQGYCLTCAARIDGAGRWDESDAISYYPADRNAGFILPCTAKARSNLRLRTHQQNAMRQFRKKNGLPAPYSWTNE